ncbi:uncharacterized protein [Venturia canescens]|uniref:uncharacterized protein isoform X3 n=1 Tax=Venturia canescens TaxID=32260 RepID=UPI001C9C4EC7|nr:uncharacterized protein LOC122416317 isoform X3 [Venturia canescens]
MASGLPGSHRRKLGPAPIASFEDLSDELENAEASVVRMPGIVEVTTPVIPGSSLKTPSTPRIDISRASSSSHHEDSNNSRESSPERELLAGGEPPVGCKLSLGYKEDVQDLRSSTEELDLQDPIHEQDLKREAKKARRRREGGTQSECGGTSSRLQERERKDSNCSEIILLNISGRTSRLSSVGSQGSGVSGKLSVLSATSSRSPSPHKCLLETSFCGSKPTLADNLIEPSKPETDDLEKILLKREADTTKALIPDNIKVPIVGGNIKPDPLDKPRRRGREERKEIFKREVEITKKVLERVNIEVPIVIKKPESHQADPDKIENTMVVQDVQKPATLNLNEKRKKAPNFKEIPPTTPTNIASLGGSPKLPRHQKIRDLEGSRTPSPSSVSRKSSFASLFKGKTEGSVISPESPSPSTKPRRSLTTKIKDTTESLRSRSKSRERVSIDKGSSLKRDSKNKNVFTSTLSLFKKRERKKSTDDGTSTPEMEIATGDNPSLESIGNVEFTFDTDRASRKNEDSIFISLHADSRNYEVALPSESVSIPLETPTKLLDEYENEAPSSSIVTEVSIEHQASISRIRTEAKIENTWSSSRDSIPNSSRPASVTIESQVPKSSSRDSKISVQSPGEIAVVSRSGSVDFSSKIGELRTSTSFGKNSGEKKSPEITKPKRKSKETRQSSPTQIENDFIDREPKVESQKSEIIDFPFPSATHSDTRPDEHLLAKPPQVSLEKTPSIISDLDHNSSESERDSEIDFIRNKAERVVEELPDERKGLCYEESFEEDLPYVPTTLPMEKSVAVPILPIKQRVQEVRTIPTERPRSTTPINPTLLDEFVMQTPHDEKRTDRMKISLPREDSFKLKSPRKHQTNTFTEFAGRVVLDGNRRVTGKSPSPPPPLPPRAPAVRPTNWINFEEIPERRKAPKRIQTIPRTEEDSKGGYSYVQPEECRCECHEESRKNPSASSSTSTSNLPTNVNVTPGNTSGARTSSTCGTNGERSCNGDNCSNVPAPLPPPSSGDRASIVSDSSLDYSLSIEDHLNNQTNLLPSMTPFSMDLDVGSNRSSLISQEDNDDPHPA